MSELSREFDEIFAKLTALSIVGPPLWKADILSMVKRIGWRERTVITI
jgi:hypothetical protein